MHADPRFQISTDPPIADPPVWHAFRPEIRSSSLRWSDLKALAGQQLLRREDFIWCPGWETWRPASEVPGLFGPPLAVQTEPELAAHRPPQSIKERARHEFQSYMIITVYIWVIISLMRLHEALLADTYNFTYESQGRAIVIALILGKVVLIAEALRLGEYTSTRLPALSVVIRSVLFAAAILAFHACEDIAVGLWHGESLASIIAELSRQEIWRSVLLAGVMTIALMPYFLIKEIERRTGQSNLLLLAIGLKR